MCVLDSNMRLERFGDFFGQKTHTHFFISIVGTHKPSIYKWSQQCQEHFGGMVLTMSPNNVSGPNNANEKTHGSPNNAVPAYAHTHTHPHIHTHSHTQTHIKWKKGWILLF